MKKIMFLTICLCVCLWSGVESERIGSKAPLFTASTIGGDYFDLKKELKKGPVVINFWSIFCLTCKAEMKAMKEELYQKYTKKNVQFLSITSDEPTELKLIKKYLKEKELPFEVIMDSKGEIATVPYEVMATPELVLIDQNGIIQYHHQGYRDGDIKHLETALEKVLKK